MASDDLINFNVTKRGYGKVNTGLPNIILLCLWRI